MRKPLSDQLHESILYPERAYRLFLCPSDFDLLAIEDFDLFEVPPVFCEALVYFLLKAKRKSGFAKLEIRTEVVKQSRKRVVHWESGTSEREYLTEEDWEELGQYFDQNFHRQITKHCLMR